MKSKNFCFCSCVILIIVIKFSGSPLGVFTKPNCSAVNIAGLVFDVSFYFQITKMRLCLSISVFVVLLSTTFAQIFPGFGLLSSPPFNPTPHFIPQPITQSSDFAHPEVVANSIEESQLPPEMLNDFYKNPIIVSRLAKDSWFGNKEVPVFERETSKIPRSQIIKIFRNAGWIRRRR